MSVTWYPRSRRVLELALLAALSPFAYWLADYSPPWTRLSEGSYIDPVHAGGDLQVHWRTTPLVRDCPGDIQVEIISGYVVWPVMRRQVNSSLYIGQTEYEPPTWPVANEVPPGKVVYRVTTFWDCNWFRKFLGIKTIQVGPDITFEVLPAVLPPGTTIAPSSGDKK